MRLDPLFVVLVSLIGRGCGEAAELRTKDVPEACLVICNPVVLLSNACYIEEDTTSSSSSPILVVPVSTITPQASRTQQQGQPPSAFAPEIIDPQTTTSQPSNRTSQTFTSHQVQETEHEESTQPPRPSPPPAKAPPPSLTSRPPSPFQTIDINLNKIPPVSLPLEGVVIENYVAFEDKIYSDPSFGSSASAQKVQVGNSQTEKETAEKFCLCQNRSFDVQSLAGLCASCMSQNTNSSDQLSDINKIMSECAFTSTTYTPEATKSAEDLTIVALVPTLVPAGPRPSSSGGSEDGSDDDDSGITADGEGSVDGSSSSATKTAPLDEELQFMLYLLAPLMIAFLCL